MIFRLFGVISVEIQPTFWLGTLLIGLSLTPEPTLAGVLLWVAILFLAVLIHELGHAAAMLRYGLSPHITLHAAGGTTIWRTPAALRPRDFIFISAAGSLAGFLVAAIVLGLITGMPTAVGKLSPLWRACLVNFGFVNLFWSVVNLLPVLPFDGGTVLYNLLGPRRARVTAAISCGVAVLVMLFFVKLGIFLAAALFGISALRSFGIYRMAAAGGEADAPVASRGRRSGQRSTASGPIPGEMRAILNSARAALEEADYDEAIRRATHAFDSWLGDEESKSRIPARAQLEAQEIIAWAHLLDGRVEAASATIAFAMMYGNPDAALLGAVLVERGKFGDARRVLEAARGHGDDRKEVVGPLIRLLIGASEFARAAALALEIVDTLSEDDARAVGTFAYDGGAFGGAAKLFEAMFARVSGAEDAYAAARAYGRLGDQAQARAWLQRAVKAGLADRARAYDDKAFALLRDAGGFELVVPPSAGTTPQ